MKKLALCILLSLPPIWCGAIDKLEQRKELKTSVLIPCHYKHVSCLYELLSCYDQQTVLPDEIVIAISECNEVDPSHLNAINSATWKFPLKLLLTQEQQHAGHNRNRACEAAIGDIFILQDADDLPHPQRVEIIKYFFENYEIDHLMHQFVLTNAPSQVTKVNLRLFDNLEHINFIKSKTFDEVLKIKNFTNGNIAIAKEVFRTMQWGGKSSGQDLDFNKAVYSKFKNLYLILTPLLIYRNYLSSHENVYPFSLHDHQETLELIKHIITKKEKGAYLRIGDGDVWLAAGIDSGTHRVSGQLQTEEQQVLKWEGVNIVKTLPMDTYVYQIKRDQKNQYYDSRYVETLKNRAAPLWGEDKNVYSAQFLSHYAVVDPDRCIEFLKFLKKSNCSLFVGNQHIPQEIRTLLFGPQCKFVGSPERNAFCDLQRIEKEALEQIEKLDPQSHHVIIVCVGNTGRVLVKRIYDKVGNNIFFFDFGSLIDAICGFHSRGWIPRHYRHHTFFPLLEKGLENIQT